MSDRLMTIIAVVSVLLIVGTLVIRSQLEPDAPGEALKEQSVVEKAPEQYSRVIAKMETCDRVGERTVMKGYVENTGTLELSMVTVQPIWKNAAGLIVETGVVFVASRDKPLKPGERRTFEDVTERSNITRCNVEPLDWGV